MPSHIYRSHLSPSVRKMCPTPNLPLKGENIIIFSNKTFKVLIFVKIYTLLNLTLVKIWTTEKTYKICLVKTTARMLDWWNIWPFIMIFMSYLFFLFRRLLSQKWVNVKKNVCWRISLPVTSLTTNPFPSKKRKIYQNL